MINNEAIYYATGKTYSGLRTARNPGAYRNSNHTEIMRHEAARSFLKAMYPDGNIPTIKDLQAQKKLLEDSLGESERELTSSNARLRELRTVQQNLSSMIHSQPNKISWESEAERDWRTLRREKKVMNKVVIDIRKNVPLKKIKELERISNDAFHNRGAE